MIHHKKIKHLRRDPSLRKVIDRIKDRHPFFRNHEARRANHFRELVVAIVNQQLSGKAADTILRRVVGLFPKRTLNNFPTPQEFLKIAPQKLRKAGLSNMKVSFVKDLSKKVLDGTVNFRKMKNWRDEEVIAHLSEVKGIGRWTAEMFLIFSLGRDDVFSYGDLGLRNAMRNIYGFKKSRPPHRPRGSLARSPYRSWACRYLWASLDVKKVKAAKP